MDDLNDLYSRILALCEAWQINITTMCRESGASRASLTDLKMGRTQSLSADTLRKISAYFDVSMDYLLADSAALAEAQPAPPGYELLTPENRQFVDEMVDKLLTLQGAAQDAAREEAPPLQPPPGVLHAPRVFSGTDGAYIAAYGGRKFRFPRSGSR